jgi:hypothetical protein
MAVAVHGVLLAGAELAEQDLGAAFLDADQGGDLLAGQARAGAGLLLGDELGDCRPRIACACAVVERGGVRIECGRLRLRCGGVRVGCGCVRQGAAGKCCAAPSLVMGAALPLVMRAGWPVGWPWAWS